MSNKEIQSFIKCEKNCKILERFYLSDDAEDSLDVLDVAIMNAYGYNSEESKKAEKLIEELKEIVYQAMVKSQANAKEALSSDSRKLLA